MIVLGRQLAAWTLVLAIAASTPVIGWCATAQHQGQPLHPLFEHTHQVMATGQHGVTDHQMAHHDVASRPPSEQQAGQGTSWSASAPLGSAGWMSGIQVIPPSGLPVAVPEIGPGIGFDVPRPTEYRPGPSFPPPRRSF